jgi:HSP20 family protein
MSSTAIARRGSGVLRMRFGPPGAFRLVDTGSPGLTKVNTISRTAEVEATKGELVMALQQNSWSSDPRASFDLLRRGLDEWFDRAAGARSARRTGTFPPVNLYEIVDGYVLTAELPGLAAGDIEVSIEGNRVTLGGKREIEHPQDASLHRAERVAGGFRRSIELPAQIDSGKAEATYRNGVLMLRLAKAEQFQPRKIAVNASGREK